MIKIILISLIFFLCLIILMKNFAKIKFFLRGLLNNSFLRLLLFKGLWRLIKLLIFKR
jgi:hypothetical protein